MKNKLIILFLSLILSVFLWISITLSSEYNSSLTLSVKLINAPLGYVPVATTPNEVNVKIKGKGWNILTTMLTTQNDYYVDAGKEIQKKQVLELKSFANGNPWLTSRLQILEVTPDTMSFSFEKIGYAKKKIVPHLRLDFKDGYGLAGDIIVFPESTLVSGPISKINSLVDVPTEIVKTNELSEKTERNVSLKNIKDIEYEFQTVALTIDVQQVVEQNYSDVNVSVINVPNDRDIVLLPNQITVQLRGGIDVLGKLDKSQINASIYFHEIIADTTGSITPKIEVPNHTKLVSINPERLKYIIKKFSK
jgi:hypothetical protein